ncbi:MAG: hypothetical protein A3F84_01295 [Candidatus Handelsmanbacteria bacterium RIFCSPLOWO2_12_FULL_64_10]|uniref:Ester cyclase n=1 Tax=Handelsmanbacteria sp. (strain RIFCSPLOWO2_12_FULL_64_10) TaxID=1817868 RepID=A0A1F6CX98_HANXR|nr:MAG: hypothetical protein A3F84_01295 [Candidatus Handelsmanbacteria bacterium RIFCSPLOWO2_12_FULL_64_10]
MVTQKRTSKAPPTFIRDIEANKALVRRFLQDLDGLGARQALENNTTPDVIVHFPRGLSPEPLQRAAYEAAAGMFRAAFPDLRHPAEDISAEGDRVWLRGTNQGTHRGEFQGIAPTGNPVTFSVMSEYRVQNGKIAEMWVEADMIGLMQQLGVQLLPPRSGA